MIVNYHQLNTIYPIQKNQVKTCKIFGCSERSLMRWVDKYKSTNNITQRKEIINRIKLLIVIYHS